MPSECIGNNSYRGSLVRTLLHVMMTSRLPSPDNIPSHFTRIPTRHICSCLYKSKKVYESKGHRFESCPVHHKPPTCFAPLAVFLFALYCWKISRFAACARWAAAREFCYVFIASFSVHQTDDHKSYRNNICSTPDFS